MGWHHIVDQLIKGSSAVDRMQTEIKQVLGIVSGLVLKNLPADQIKKEFECDEGLEFRLAREVERIRFLFWKVKVNRPTGLSKAKITVELWSSDSIRDLSDQYHLEWESGSGKPIPIELVKEARSILWVLVRGMNHHFLISSQWQPLIDAADSRFEGGEI